jgi:hypothetical protein
MTARGRPAPASPCADPVTFNYLIFLNFLILPKKFDVARLLLIVGQEVHTDRKYQQTSGGRHPYAFMGALMLTALILVCSLAVTPDLSDCSQSNAVDTMYVPEQFANPATCFMHGQAYLAETAIGRDINQDERVKVVCVRSKSTTVGMSLK